MLRKVTFLLYLSFSMCYFVVAQNAPIAENDTFYLASGVLSTIDILANDEDPDGGSIGVLSTSNPPHGTVTTGLFIEYQSDAGYAGVDSFDYVIVDTEGLSDSARVYLFISLNNPPLAMNDFAIVDQNDSLLVDVLFNDEEPDGNTLILNTILTAASHGSQSISNDKLFYKPNDCFFGIDSIEYLACDDQNPALCDSAWLYLDVNQIINFEANDDYFTLATLDSLYIEAQLNDSLYNAQMATTDILQAPSQGSLSVLNSDSILFVPSSTFIGTDTIVYQLCDECLYCDTAEVIIQYLPLGISPTASNDFVFIVEDEDTVIDVLSNDIDPFGTGLIVTVIEPPVNGIVGDLGVGEMLYQPNANYFGTDSFTYEICAPANGLCDTAEVFITIESIDDLPIAGDDNASGIEDQILIVSVLNNDIDVDSYPLTIDIIVPPVNGTANVLNDEIQYIPSLNFIGFDQLTYVVCDTISPIMCDTAEVYFTILGVNDPPFANDEMVSTSEDNLLMILALQNDNDPDGDNISGSFITLPLNGSAIFLSGDTILYNPSLNFNGLDSLEYIVCDDVYPPLCDTAWAIIEVTEVNDKPIAQNDNASTEQGFAITIEVQDNDSDIEQQPLNSLVVIQPFNGNLAIAGNNQDFVYQPNLGFVGTDQFTYSICDNGAPILCDTAIVFITVENNPSPVAVNDTAYTDSTVPVLIDALGNDFDPNDDVLTYAILSLPANGISLNNFNGTFTYTSDPGFIGWDSFTYYITDDGMPQGQDVGTVYIYVDIPNETPIAQNDTIEILEGDSILFYPLSNDSDADGDALIISNLDPGSLGNISLNGDGSVLYEGIYGNSGMDVLLYEICDSLGACSTASIVINVLAFDSQAIINQIPNAISPNGDGYNDTFEIPNVELYNSQLIIYDRWGIKVYSSSDYQNNWGGTYENSSLKVPTGTYYYTIQLIYASQPALSQSGYIQIVN